MKGQRDPKFYSELKQLNDDLLDYLKLSREKTPFFDFSPTLKDYVKQFADLERQYPSDQTTTTANKTSQQNLDPSPPKLAPAQNSMSSFVSAAPFVPSSTFAPLSSSTYATKIPQITSSSGLGTGCNLSFVPKTIATTTPGHTFLNSISTPAAPAAASTSASSAFTITSSTTNPTHTVISQAPTMQPFLFGSALIPPASSVSQPSSLNSSSSTPFFSFTMPQPPKSNDDNNKLDAGGADNTTLGEEEHQPPEPKIDKYEEPDAKHSAKCKLYEKAKGTGSEINVNLLGIGVLYVKALDTPSKLQVIVRQEPDLRRVLLNEVITSNIPVKLLPKAVQMVVPGSTGESKLYIVKVKDENEANTLYEMLNLNKV